MDEVLKDGPNRWIKSFAWTGGDPNQHQVGTMGATYPIKNTPNSWAHGQPTQTPSWMVDVEDQFRDLAEEMETSTNVSHESKDVRHH